MQQMKTDKRQFDAVLKRMLQTPAQKTSEIKAEKKVQTKKPKPGQKWVLRIADA